MGVARLAIVIVASSACGAPRSAPDAGAPDAMPDAAAIACHADADCTAAHTVCDTTSACSCAAGYAADVNGACAWRGVIADPGCSASGTWNLHGHTVVDATLLRIGMVDVGACVFYGFTDADPNCTTGNAYFDQTITMPRAARAEPLVLQASYDNDSMNGFGVQFVIGSSIVAVPNPFGGTKGWTSARTCAPAAAYADASSTGPGAPMPFWMEITTPSVCLFDSQLYVDRVELVPAMPGECPPL